MAWHRRGHAGLVYGCVLGWKGVLELRQRVAWAPVAGCAAKGLRRNVTPLTSGTPLMSGAPLTSGTLRDVRFVLHGACTFSRGRITRHARALVLHAQGRAKSSTRCCIPDAEAAQGVHAGALQDSMPDAHIAPWLNPLQPPAQGLWPRDVC